MVVLLARLLVAIPLAPLPKRQVGGNSNNPQFLWVYVADLKQGLPRRMSRGAEVKHRRYEVGLCLFEEIQPTNAKHILDKKEIKYE